MNICSNIKIARLSKGITQEKMAIALGVKRSTYSNWELTTEPDYDTLRRIAHILDVEPSSLLKEKTYNEQRRDLKNTQTENLVAMVPVKAGAGYVKSYDQTDYINTLEMYMLPPGVNPAGSIWRYFEVDGSSMEPTFRSGDVVLASQVNQEDWNQLRNFYIYIIITADKVLIKRIYTKSPDQFVLISDNEKEYPQELLSVSEVKELWVFRRRIDSHPAPPKEFKIKI